MRKLLCRKLNLHCVFIDSHSQDDLCPSYGEKSLLSIQAGLLSNIQKFSCYLVATINVYQCRSRAFKTYTNRHCIKTKKAYKISPSATRSPTVCCIVQCNALYNAPTEASSALHEIHVDPRQFFFQFFKNGWKVSNKIWSTFFLFKD